MKNLMKTGKIMKDLIKKLRNKGLLKIILASLFEILIVCVILSTDDVELVGKIVCLVLWSILCLVYFVSGIINIKNYKINVYQYTNIPNYKELDNEYNKSKKFSGLYVGDEHVFVISSNNFYVLNLKNIESMHYLHLGYNYLKGRPGYYYLYLKEDKKEETIKIYFVSKQNLKDAMDYLKSKNNNIIIK